MCKVCNQRIKGHSERFEKQMISVGQLDVMFGIVISFAGGTGQARLYHKRLS